jgi:tetratricopeptide (TPR) repeat protein
VLAYLFITLFLATPVRSTELTSTDQHLLTQALAAYNEERNQEAEPILRDLASRYPKKFEIVETLGLIYAERDELPRALPLLETAVNVNTDSALAYANLGAAYLRLNRNEDAVRVLSRAASLDPHNSQTQSSFGQALMLAKRYRAAADAFAAASAADPTNPDILYNWALAAFDSGDADDASKILAKIPTSLRSAEAQSLQADIDEKQGHFDTALAVLQNAARLDPSEANLNAVGVELLRHWSFDPAIVIFEYGISKYPSSARLQVGLAVSRYANHQFDQSARIFSRLLAASPDDASYANFLAQSCAALKGQSHEGCDGLLAYAERHPNNASVATAIAAAILEEHDPAKLPLARRLLDEALAAAPNSAAPYFQLGVWYQQQARWKDSVGALEKAAALSPASSKTHLKLALAYSHLNQPEEARRQAVLQRECRKTEQEEAEARRTEINTFLVNMH